MERDITAHWAGVTYDATSKAVEALMRAEGGAFVEHGCFIFDRIADATFRFPASKTRRVMRELRKISGVKVYSNAVREG